MSLPDFKKYLDHKEILGETLQILNKDFAQAGEDEIIPPSFVPSFEGLIALVIPVIGNLYYHHRQKFMNLLYRVDISEHMLISATYDKEGDELIREIAVLIVKRELQKVVIRNFYKGK